MKSEVWRRKVRIERGGCLCVREGMFTSWESASCARFLAR